MNILQLHTGNNFIETEINGTVEEIKSYFSEEKLIALLFNVSQAEYFKHLETIYENDEGLRQIIADKHFYAEWGKLKNGKDYCRLNVTIFKIFGTIYGATIERIVEDENGNLKHTETYFINK
jgi:hypothetical protein